MKWVYDGYTKVKTGSGRHSRFIENHIYKCPDCGWSVRVERTQKPPRFCPNCQKDMRGERKMRTITYTYDEENPTNRDYLIAVLTDSIDDGGASYDSVVVYDIDCPYGSLANCLNEHEKNKYSTVEYADGCLRCKRSWLNRRYDTYPSDDGRWEIEVDE